MRRSGQPSQEEKPTTVARKSDREIVVTRTFDSPAGAVFDAWTQAELFRLWWAPRSMGAALSGCEIDARTGGGYRITFGGDGSDPMTFFGKYLEVTPPARRIGEADPLPTPNRPPRCRLPGRSFVVPTKRKMFRGKGRYP